MGKTTKIKATIIKQLCCYKGWGEESVLTTKTAFFCYVAGIVEPFLKEYQTDIPMIPFLYFDLKAVIRNLLDIAMDPLVIELCCSGNQFKEIDLSKKGI